MPIYVFKCKSCEKDFEVFERKIKYPIDYKCPHCGSHNVYKCIAPTSFILKGSGWARDNYSSTKNKSTNKGE